MCLQCSATCKLADECALPPAARWGLVQADKPPSFVTVHAGSTMASPAADVRRRYGQYMHSVFTKALAQKPPQQAAAHAAGLSTAHGAAQAACGHADADADADACLPGATKAAWAISSYTLTLPVSVLVTPRPHMALHAASAVYAHVHGVDGSRSRARRRSSWPSSLRPATSPGPCNGPPGLVPSMAHDEAQASAHGAAPGLAAPAPAVPALSLHAKPAPVPSGCIGCSGCSGCRTPLRPSRTAPCTPRNMSYVPGHSTVPVAVANRYMSSPGHTAAPARPPAAPSPCSTICFGGLEVYASHASYVKAQLRSQSAAAAAGAATAAPHQPLVKAAAPSAVGAAPSHTSGLPLSPRRSRGLRSESMPLRGPAPVRMDSSMLPLAVGAGSVGQLCWLARAAQGTAERSASRMAMAKRGDKRR